MRYYKYLQFPPRKHPPNIGKSPPYLDKSFLPRKSSGYFQTIPFVPLICTILRKIFVTANLSECDKCFSSNCKLNLCKRVYLIGASMVKLAKCQIENRFIGSSTVDAILSGGKRFGFSKCPDFEEKIERKLNPLKIL